MSKVNLFVKKHSSKIEIMFFCYFTALMIYPMTNSNFMSILEKTLTYNYVWLLLVIMTTMGWIDKPIELAVNYIKRRKLNVR